MNITHLSKVIIVFGILCALVFGAVSYYLWNQKGQTIYEPDGPLSDTFRSQDRKEVIKRLPEGLFVESNSSVFDMSAHLVEPRGNTTIERNAISYKSSKNFLETTNFFTNYLESNGWVKVSLYMNEEMEIGLYNYKKDNSAVTISVTNSVDKTVFVNIAVETKI